jgi:hypothetical protein
MKALLLSTLERTNWNQARSRQAVGTQPDSFHPHDAPPRTPYLKRAGAGPLISILATPRHHARQHSPAFGEKTSGAHPLGRVRIRP